MAGNMNIKHIHPNPISMPTQPTCVNTSRHLILFIVFLFGDKGVQHILSGIQYDSINGFDVCNNIESKLVIS